MELEQVWKGCHAKIALLALVAMVIVSAVGQRPDDAIPYDAAGLTTQGSGAYNFHYIQFQKHEPKIVVAPFSHKVPAKSRVSFYCKASGHPAPYVTWRKNNKTLNERRNRYISKETYWSTLTLESVGDKQEGVYQCVADNGVRSPAVANATLSVYEEGQALPAGFPVVREFSNDSLALIENGFPMRLRCRITGSPMPEVTWYRDKTPVDVDADRVRVMSRDGVPGVHDLHVTATKKELDHGDYFCMGRNVHGTVYSKQIKVFVKEGGLGNQPDEFSPTDVRRYAPTFTIQPDPQNHVIHGGSLNLTCVAVGSPMPHVSWKKDGLTLISPTRSPIGKNVLQLTNIFQSENYSCVAESGLGTIVVWTQVLVQALPSGPGEIWANDVTPISAKIIWSASPRVKGPIATEEPEYVIQFRKFDVDNMREWSEQGEGLIGKQLSFILSGLVPYTKYEVRVVPQINYGRGSPSEIRHFLTKESAPGSAPHEVKAKPVSSSTALIQWRPPLQPNGDIVRYEVIYILAENEHFDKSRWTMRSALVSAQMVVLDGLARAELYAVAVRAVNQMGAGPFSEPVQLSMDEEGEKEVPLAPSNLVAVDITATTINLAWDKPDTEGILSYEISINNSRTRTHERHSVLPPRERFTLEHLTPNTLYNLRVAARSSVDVGPHSNTIQVRTLESEPSSAPINVQAAAPDISTAGSSSNANTKLIVTWEAPPSAQSNGVVTGYTLYYKPDGVSDSPTQLEISDSTQRQQVLEGLQVWTRYRIRMTASTSAGEGPMSEPVIARTEEAVPDAPRGFHVSPINSSAVLLKWRRMTERAAKGVLKGYYIFQTQYDSNGEKIGGVKSTMTVDGTAINYTAGGLEARQRYVFQIKAYNRAGDGDLSPPKTVETLGAVPTAPQDFHLELLDEDSARVRVTWNRPEEVHGSLLSYRLMWGRRSDRVLANTIPIGSSQNVHVVRNMMKGTEYEFRLQAQNEENYGVAAVDHIRTEDGVPSGSPRNIQASYRSDSSALVSWQELDPGLRNGVITLYQVRYQDKDNTIDLRAVNTSELSVLLDDLTPGAKYSIQVVAFTSAGAGPTSYRVPYNTIQSRPPAPTEVKAKRVGATSIRVTWKAPLASVSGYRVMYSTTDLGPGDTDWQMDVVSHPSTSYELTGLDSRSAYAIKVQALSSNGEPGLESDEVFVNEVEAPQLPDHAVQDIQVSHVTATQVELSWQTPVKPGVQRYKIEFTGRSRLPPTRLDEQRVISVASSLTEKLVDGLKPDFVYTFSVRPKFTGESDFREALEETLYIVTTKPVAAPQLKQQQGAAVIAFSRDKNNFDDVYVIVAHGSESRSPSLIALGQLKMSRSRRAVDSSGDASQNVYIAGKFKGSDVPNEFTIGDEKEYGEYVNKALEPGVIYKSFVRVIVQSEEFSSNYSGPFTSAGPLPETAPNTAATTPPSENMVPLIGGPIGGGVVIVLIVAIIMVVVRRNKTQKKEHAPEPTKLSLNEPVVFPKDPVELRRMQHSTPGMQSHPPIPVQQLSTHIEQLRAQDNHKFAQEYESIEPGQQFTWENSNLEYNKPKNRYANVIAYDHSRVVLQSVDGMPGSDYINANYIDGYRKQNAYISTQGPLSETFGDFWRMVWEQRSATIVMMTKLEERARVKCDAYWPSEGSEMYGPIVVTITDCMELATYTVRTFQIEREGWAEKREMRQFQFTAWPDHGVPDYPTPLLIFMRRVKAATPSDSGPMVVHCSAGVGRTGAFIVIDAMLERIKHEKTVDVYGHVTCLRAQRNYMVQTEDQYIFIHDALLEAVLSGNTEIPARSLYSHIQKLAQSDGTNNGMEKEFKALSNTKINSVKIVTANLPVNKYKNRLVNVLPFESNRVCLLPIRGVEGSDYINASFIDGYRFKKAYIATQGPLAETTEDFWRMLWEHNCTIVVMLTKTREMGRDKCHQYWPESRSARYQYFVVDPHAEYPMPEYTLREFKVTDARDGQSRTVRLFQFSEWPEQGVPKSGVNFIQFTGQVHKTKEQFGQEGPIAVHCSAGVGRTGVFITLSIILERMRYEGVVDMFQTVKMLRTQRQGMVQTEDQYSFCYQAALDHLASFDHY